MKPLSHYAFEDMVRFMKIDAWELHRHVSGLVGAVSVDDLMR